MDHYNSRLTIVVKDNLPTSQITTRGIYGELFVIFQKPK
jgi:hypothetical protein